MTACPTANDTVVASRRLADLELIEARFQRITANVPGMIYQFVLHSNGAATFPYASDGCRELFGVEPADLAATANTLIALIHPDDLPNFQQSVGASAAALAPWMWEGRFVLASGAVKWVQAVSRPERQADGAIVWDGMLLDITGRVEAEVALHASETRFKRMTANVPGMVFQFCLHPDGQITWPFVSDGCQELYGHSPAEIQSAPTIPVAVVHPDDLAGFQSSVAESAATLGPWNWEGRIVPRLGILKWVQASSRPEMQDDGSIIWDGILMDITTRKQAEEALRHSSVQDETIRAQAAILDELSTPLLPISDQVVVMPLVGAVDTQRTRRVVEALLHGVEARRAQIAILDITGVPVVDTSVAHALIHAAQAVRLLGAEAVLTGVRPEVAQTLVGLGIQLSGMITHSSLQSGIAYALSQSERQKQTRRWTD